MLPAWRPKDGMMSGRSLALRPRRAKQAPPWPGFGRKHAMEADQMQPRTGNQRGESLYEFQR